MGLRQREFEAKLGSVSIVLAKLLIDRMPTFEREVCEERYIVCALPTLCESCENEESLPASPVLTHPDTLYTNCQWIKIVLRDTSVLHYTNSAEPSIEQENKREDDAARKDPPGDVEWYCRLNFSRPSVEREEVDRCECVDRIH